MTLCGLKDAGDLLISSEEETVETDASACVTSPEALDRGRRSSNSVLHGTSDIPGLSGTIMGLRGQHATATTPPRSPPRAAVPLPPPRAEQQPSLDYSTFLEQQEFYDDFRHSNFGRITYPFPSGTIVLRQVGPSHCPQACPISTHTSYLRGACTGPERPGGCNPMNLPRTSHIALLTSVALTLVSPLDVPHPSSAGPEEARKRGHGLGCWVHPRGPSAQTATCVRAGPLGRYERTPSPNCGAWGGDRDRWSGSRMLHSQ